MNRGSIVVGALNKDGARAIYSNNGANLLVSGPAGEWGPANITTTDRTGSEGYNGIDTSYTDDFNGTSAAAPMVSGVAALMLEANPTLGWRDVKQILARSADYTGTATGISNTLAKEDYGWQINTASDWNGGGLHYSGDYGYGKVNAYTAVALAETWLLPGQDVQTSHNEIQKTAIEATVRHGADDSLLSFDMTISEDMYVESVSLYLDWSSDDQAENWTITLTSPNETTFVLADAITGYLGAYTAFFTPGVKAFYGIEDLHLALKDEGYSAYSATTGTQMTFGLEGFIDESALGDWTVKIKDTNFASGDTNDFTINQARLDIYGRDASADDTFYYTDEFAAMVDGDASRGQLMDTDGGTDTLNAAAVTSAITLNMAAGVGGNLGAKALTIDADTTIENYIGGSGIDTITGNSAANKMWGREGADVLDGQDGNDWISGGYGNDTLAGGAGADTFAFTHASGTDTIMDFEMGTDKVELLGYGLDRSGLFDLLNFTTEGYARFDDGGTQVIFQGVNTLAGIEDSFILIA